MNQFNIRAYLEKHFELRESGDFLYFKCVFCGGLWKMWFNVVDRRPWAWCYKCSTWADPTKFIMRHQGVERWRAREIILSGSGRLPGLELRIQKRAHRTQRGNALPVEYMKVRPGNDDPIGKLAYGYLRRRGVTDEQIEERGIGYCFSGKYSGCVILPITVDGVVVYFQGRAFCRPGVKYLNPDKAEFGTGKSEVVFNLDRARRLLDVVICEGYFDVLAAGDEWVSPLGKKLSDEQLAMIANAGVRSAGVCFDKDAKKETMEAVERLTRAGVEAYPMRPVGKDPSESGGAAIRKERSFKDYILAKMGGASS